jgi:hypothetical protein
MRPSGQGRKLFSQVPPQQQPLSQMFQRLEAAKAQLNIAEYSLSQTTLEQVRLLSISQNGPLLLMGWWTGCPDLQ